jgi:PBP4 family serine-type D-alanyl-D-alanine carboxypeptidase
MRSVKIYCLILALLIMGCDSASSDNVVTNGLISPLPADIQAVMSKPRYAQATWSLLVTDVETGESFYPLNPDRLSFTGSTRKLFSVGMALNTMGADRRQTTAVHRQGTVDNAGVLNGDLILVAGGDLSFGGRRINADTIQFTDLDHNDANNLGTAILTPQDPLFALDQLAISIKAAGIDSVTGEIAIDDRLFETYRVPNGNLLITPMMLNENHIDVTLTPAQSGQSAGFDYRPMTGFFAVMSQVVTGAVGTAETVEFSGDRLTSGVGDTGTVQGNLPVDYVAPLSGLNSYVGTFRVEDPNAFARTAFIEALQRHGVTVAATPVSANPDNIIPPTFEYPAGTRVAEFVSPPYAQAAQLILKVSLNLGANLSLSLFGLEKGQRTLDGALAAERQTLVQDFGIDGEQFRFPTNGSGSPDSEAAPRAMVKLLVEMSKTPVADQYQASLPVLGVDGSLSNTGTTLPGKGHVFAKTGTTIAPNEQGILQLKAQCLGGYIETQGGRKVAYALMVNDAGPVLDIESDVGGVFEDQGVISSLIYESL